MEFNDGVCVLGLHGSSRSWRFLPVSWRFLQEKGGYADRVKFVVNILTLGLVTGRVALVDWPEVRPFFRCPYFQWQLQDTAFRLPKDVV